MQQRYQSDFVYLKALFKVFLFYLHNVVFFCVSQMSLLVCFSCSVFVNLSMGILCVFFCRMSCDQRAMDNNGNKLNELSFTFCVIHGFRLHDISLALYVLMFYMYI